MDDDDTLISARARSFDRAAPAASDAVSFTGGIGIALGVLLLTVNFSVHGDGRAQGVLLFALLVALGYLALLVLPRPTHPAAVTVIVTGVLGTFGWWILPHAHRFADIRPFLVLVILAYAGLYLAPRTRGRTIFVAAALIILWFWMLGEVAGTDAYSAAPIPSPPAHTMFSLSGLTHAPPVIETRAEVTLDQLDQSSPFYPQAVLCSDGEGFACDSLFRDTPVDSPFHTFADTCGNTQPVGSGGQCATLEGSGVGNTIPFEGGSSVNQLVPPVGLATHDKSLDIGIVSLLFGIVYLGALWGLDQRRRRALGTALVVPAILALFTGTEALGNAAQHAWFGGLLTFVAGIVFALVGDIGGRRFSAWAGGLFAAFGAYTIAGDVANLKASFGSDNNHLVRPALIAIGAGAVLVAIAMVVAALRRRLDGPTPGRPATAPPGFPPAPVAAGPAPAGGASWAPPPQPGPSAPWQPPVQPPPSAPWSPPPEAPPPSAPWSPPAQPAPWQPPAQPPPSAPWQPPPEPPTTDPGRGPA